MVSQILIFFFLLDIFVVVLVTYMYSCFLKKRLCKT